MAEAIMQQFKHENIARYCTHHACTYRSH